MKSLFSWLIIMFSFMFWAFRVAVVLVADVGGKFIVLPLNSTIEVIMLFVTFILLILISKRKLIPAVLYFGMYSLYFGVDLYENITAISKGNLALNLDLYTSLFISAIAMIIAFIQLFDVVIDKSRKGNESHKKTDWFYKNEDYDRKLDERSDKNNYRIL